MEELPSTAPVWPRGIFANALVLLLAVASAVAFFPELEIVQTGWLKPVHTFALNLFRDQWTVVKVVQLGYVIHVFEAIYASYLCRRSTLPMSHATGWCALTLLFGFPALEILMKICNQIPRVKAAAGDGSGRALGDGALSGSSVEARKKEK